MPQHDYILDNASGAAFRADLNNALAAIVSLNSEATEPATTYAYQFWADTTTGLLKQRNAANSAWITLMTLSTGVMAANAALAGSASQVFNVEAATADDHAVSRVFGDARYAALAGSASQDFAANAFTASGGVSSISATALVGYGTGAGGTVTQATSKSTAVTLNTPSGEITMHNAALAAGASVNFTLNNTSIAANSLVLVNPVWAAIAYDVSISNAATAAVSIRVTNITGGSLSNAVVIRFAVIGGATA